MLLSTYMHVVYNVVCALSLSLSLLHGSWLSSDNAQSSRTMWAVEQIQRRPAAGVKQEEARQDAEACDYAVDGEGTLLLVRVRMVRRS